jgi:hypothetical protein
MQRWTERIIQDYMNQLNYLMQPVSPAVLISTDILGLPHRSQGVGSDLKASPRLDRFFYDLPTTSGRRNIHARTNQAIGAQTIVNVHEIFPSDSVILDQFVYSGE